MKILLWCSVCVVGAFVFGVGIWLFNIESPSVLDAIASIIAGAILMYMGIVKLSDG